ncbi:MAG: carbohydrate binding family 9 domain-containing protein, partial [Gemmatimonadetes bacterium]|nr:carbohydrate binding family 9 domain-containing protein [Gemmatimonadota bacterium]
MIAELALLAPLALSVPQDVLSDRPARPIPGDRAAAAVYNGMDGQLDVVPPRLASPGIDIDGRLDDPAWSEAALLTGFSQFDPSEGIPGTQETEVLLLISEDAVYFGVRAFDDNPGGIRATLGERDTFYRTDDYIQFVLDTFNDQRQAYSIVVNPYGVQQDGLWIEGRVGRFGRNFGPPIDWNPDFVWDSEGRVEDWGYALEVKIPFKSIRFPESADQEWGLHVFRKIQRAGFDESWAPVTKDVANRLTLSGSLSGLRDLERGLFLELNPVLTGTRQGTYDAGASAFTREPVSGEFGFNAKYGLTSNLTLDGTYNPDFSQVEADAGQIAVNERFALFYEEKRPFFLEGTEIFTMPKNLVYTRSIINPVAGVKL